MNSTTRARLLSNGSKGYIAKQLLAQPIVAERNRAFEVPGFEVVHLLTQVLR